MAEYHVHIVIESAASYDINIADDVEGFLFKVPAGKTVTYDVVDRAMMERITPSLVQVDARDEFEVRIKGA